MKLTELKIAPKRSWHTLDEGNPLVCTVKLASKDSIVETVIGADHTQQILALVRGIVAESAARNVGEFVAAVTAVEAGSPELIEGASQ